MNVWILIAMILVAIAAVTWAAAMSSDNGDDSGVTRSRETATPAKPADSIESDLAARDSTSAEKEGSITDDDERPLSPVSETAS